MSNDARTTRKRKRGKRQKKAVPVMLLWTRRDQLRFTEAVERFASLVNDLERVLEPAKRKRAAKVKPADTPATPATPAGASKVDTLQATADLFKRAAEATRTEGGVS